MRPSEFKKNIKVSLLSSAAHWEKVKTAIFNKEWHEKLYKAICGHLRTRKQKTVPNINFSEYFLEKCHSPL